MSRENVEFVRQPLALNGRSRRSTQDRLWLRFPSIVAFVSRAGWRLPPRSRARRALLRRFSELAFDASNRGDFEVGFLLYHRDVELVTPPTMLGLGFDPIYRGRQARFDFQRRWTAEWGEMRFLPAEMFDLGDRLLYLGRINGSGVSSGAGFESEWGNILTISGGLVIREQPFFDQREALEAAGLSE
jgi:ketosteroid isomerase-like protein